MKRFAPDFLDTPEVSHAFSTELLVRVALVVAFPVVLWVLADPAAALLTLTVLGLASLLLVGAIGALDDGDNHR